MSYLIVLSFLQVEENLTPATASLHFVLDTKMYTSINAHHNCPPLLWKIIVRGVLVLGSGASVVPTPMM